MVVCELDGEVPGELMGWRLRPWQAVLLHRVLPACGGLLLYLTHISFDLTLVYVHIKGGDRGIGGFLIICMILPALISLVFTLASPPPGLRMTDSACVAVLQKNDVRWIFEQIFNCLFFPIAAVGRYCFQIFWWIEVVCACHVRDADRTAEALRVVRAPSPLELYLFLQAFVHAAPHAVLNVLNLMASGEIVYNKLSLQAVSLLASSLRMASTVAMYRRFEREKLCGKKYPWSTNTEEEDNQANEDKENEKTIESDENIYESVERKMSQASSVIEQRLNSDLIQFSPRSPSQSRKFFGSDTDSSGSFLEPLDHRATLDSDEEYARPMSIIDRVAPRRRDTQYTIEEVKVTPPPAMEAPRPRSLAAWAERVVEHAEALPGRLAAPPRHRHQERVKDEPELPRRIPRNFVRGLEPQDIAASLVHFLGWYTFFVARLLSIAAFINFHPVPAIIVLFCHYQVMLLLLIVPKASTLKRSFYIFLAFIYLFCIMEFKVRFRHVRVWHAFWLGVCSAETVLFTALWAAVNNELHAWWRNFVVTVIAGCLLLSYMCMLSYFVILKPKDTIVYIENTKSSKT